MENRATDTKLARRLQKRGKWPKYKDCLREVQRVLAEGNWTIKQIKEQIDQGKLDPKTTVKKPKQSVGFCKQPDRDQPRIECGYPLPCPFHTVVIDVASNTVGEPIGGQSMSPPQRRRVHEVAGSLRTGLLVHATANSPGKNR